MKKYEGKEWEKLVKKLDKDTAKIDLETQRTRELEIIPLITVEKQGKETSIRIHREANLYEALGITQVIQRKLEHQILASMTDTKEKW